MEIGATVRFIQGINYPGIRPDEAGTVEFISPHKIEPLALVSFKKTKVKLPLVYFEEYTRAVADGVTVDEFDAAVGRTLIPPVQNPAQLKKAVEGMATSALFAMQLRSELFDADE